MKRTTTRAAKAKRTARVKRPKMALVQTPERIETIVRLIWALGAEMRRSLRTLHREISVLDEVGGTPVMPGTGADDARGHAGARG